MILGPVAYVRKQWLGLYKEFFRLRPVLVWHNIFGLSLLHLFFMGYGVTMIFGDGLLYFFTLFKFSCLYGLFLGIGVTAGAHRMWTHKSFKAKLPLRIFLALCFAAAGHNDIFDWVRDHRVHHKYSETDADPHNSKRGFFFAHMGWLCVKKHPEVIRKGKAVNCSDIYEDPVVRFQQKYHKILWVIFVWVIPTLIPHYLYDIPLEYSFIFCGGRYILALHLAWLVNSAAHIHGTRPYDERIQPRENHFWKYFNLYGEMYHNFHHVFPQDYKTSEFGWLGQINASALFIDLMALIGQAYDLKTVPKHIVQARKLRTGAFRTEREIVEDANLGVWKIEDDDDEYDEVTIGQWKENTLKQTSNGVHHNGKATKVD